MAHNKLESIPLAALETVNGGADDGFTTGGTIGPDGTFTTGGRIGGGKNEEFTTGGSF